MNERELLVDCLRRLKALASQSFSRAEFLTKLDRFYLAVKHATATIADFSQKQQFLNTVYEKFFQGFCVKVADTHGIVYTLPSIVRFVTHRVNPLDTDFASRNHLALALKV